MFPNHPEPLPLADEAPARPPETVQPSARASCLAVLITAEDRPRELVHLAWLCRRHGLPAPAPDATHLRIELSGLRLEWERHGD